MRIPPALKATVSVVLAIAFVVLLSLPAGPLPPLGGLVNPNGGIWTVAEGADHPPRRELVLAGLDGDVTIHRDAHGVPHIFATTNHDLFLALGYVHAQDRMWQMDVQYRFAAGRLSEVLGSDTVEQDAFLRTIGLERSARRYAAALVPGDADTVALDAYAAGVNAWVSREAPRNLPLEFKLLDYAPEPWTPVHSLTSGGLVAFGLSADFSDVELGLLADGLGPAAVDELFPVDSPLQIPIVPNGTRGGGRVVHPDAARDVLRKAALVEPFLRPLRAVGSNNWVVNGSRSQSGRPLLAGDPHLRFQLPAVWYEVHLSGGDYDVYGASFPGLPGVFIGFNRFLANSETNTGADVTDFYREWVNPADPSEYRFRGQWLAFNVTTETVRVKGDAPVIVEVKESVHGPLLTEEGESLAMRWTGRDFGSELKAALLWMKATSWSEFRDALRLWRVPAQNFAVAAWDGSSGTIAIRSNGAFPVRNNTLGRVPLNGSGDYEWIGWVPFDEAPEAVNPPEGYLASANQLPAGSEYPHYLGWLWDPGYRARRINALLNDSIADHLLVRFDEMRSFQLDVYDAAAAAFVPHILSATLVCGTGLCAQARLPLIQWDFRATTDVAGPTIWYATYWKILNATFGDEWAAAGLTGRAMPFPNVLEALVTRDPTSVWFDDVRTPQVETRDDILRRGMVEATDELAARLGADPATWFWGRVHTRFFGHLTELDALSRGPYASPGNDVTLNVGAGYEARGGPSWRMVVDAGAPEDAVTVYPGGQSANPLSRHYTDQLDLWLRGEYKDVEFPATPDLVVAVSTVVLRRA